MLNLIPLPASVTLHNGKFTLGPQTAIYVAPGQRELRRIGQYLADCLHPASGYGLPVKPSNGPNSGIFLTTDGARTDLGEEGYELLVQPEQILLRAPQPAGLFHGVQTIRQLLPPAIEMRSLQPGPWQMDCVTIRDVPRFSWRGAMLDVARHFFTVEEVERLIDHLAYYKFNILHLHLTDDQGWRLMIRSWPKLAEYGGSTAVKGDRGGYYTQDDYREIIEYAGARYITIVPEVDMPSHINAALASYPELNDSGQAPPLYTGTEVGFNSLSVRKDVTYKFLEEVIREVAALTPGPYLHIGGDEAHSTPEADYKIFIERIQKIVRAQGKQCIGWEEIIKAELLPDTIVHYWWQAPLAQRAARNGNRLIFSPASKSYLDMKYDVSTPLGQFWTMNYIDVKDAYDWDPAGLQEGVEESAILGVEAPLWTETIVTEGDMDFMFFPRLTACAEIGWTPREKRHWAEYRQRLANHGPRLAGMGSNFYKSSQVGWE